VPSSTSAARFPHGLERACSVSVAGEPHEADSSGSAAAIGGARRREPTRAQPSRRGHTAAQIGEGPLTETGEYAAPSGWVVVELWGDLVAGPQIIGRVGLGERLGDAHPGVRDVPGSETARAQIEPRAGVDRETPLDARIGCRCVPAAPRPIRSITLRAPLPRALSQDRRGGVRALLRCPPNPHGRHPECSRSRTVGRTWAAAVRVDVSRGGTSAGSVLGVDDYGGVAADAD
jgi:hypothetical protein